MAMLAKDPKLRPQTARELAQAFGAVAHAHGWNTSSGAAWSADGSQSFAPQSYTPSYLPPQPTPMHTPQRPPTASPSQPTTLSGAASQSVAAPPKSKKGPILAVVAALAIVGGGVAFSVAKGSDKPAAPAAAVQPAPALVAPPAPPTPPIVEVKPLEKPAVVEVPPPIEAKPEIKSDIKPEVKAPTIAKKKPEKKPEKKPVEKKPKDSDSGDLPVETGI
jgi:hypothetical protein